MAEEGNTAPKTRFLVAILSNNCSIVDESPPVWVDWTAGHSVICTIRSTDEFPSHEAFITTLSTVRIIILLESRLCLQLIQYFEVILYAVLKSCYLLFARLQHYSVSH